MATPTNPAAGSGGSGPPTGSTGSTSTSSGPSTGSTNTGVSWRDIERVPAVSPPPPPFVHTGGGVPPVEKLLVYAVTNWNGLPHYWEGRRSDETAAIRVPIAGRELIVDIHPVASDFDPRFCFGGAYVRNSTGNECNINATITYSARGWLASAIAQEFGPEVAAAKEIKDNKEKEKKEKQAPQAKPKAKDKDKGKADDQDEFEEEQ